MQVGSLGDIVFEAGLAGRVLTPTDFTHERKAKYEEHQVVGALPRLEFCHPELAVVTLPIRLRADMGVNPMREAVRIEKLLKEGKALRLILCGVNYGMYVIETLSQKAGRASGSEFFSVELTLTLKEYA